MNLLGHDQDARRLRDQTLLLTEFLMKHVPAYQPPKLQHRAIVHEHCHHKAVLDKSAERRLFGAMGLEVESPDTGCCGMAGAFGFEREHYEVSIKAGERVLLPAVRQADDRMLIVADGFSCRERIAQMSNR